MQYFTGKRSHYFFVRSLDERERNELPAFPCDLDDDPSEGVINKCLSLTTIQGSIFVLGGRISVSLADIERLVSALNKGDYVSV